MFYKTLLVLGVIAAIAVLIYYPGGPTQPFAPTAPQFVNPFTPVKWNQQVLPGAVSTISNYPVSFHGCYSYWGCLRELGETSYLNDTPYVNFSVLSGTNNFGYKIESFVSAPNPVGYVDFKIYCRANNISASNIEMHFDFYAPFNHSLLFGDTTPTFSCPYTPNYLYPVDIYFNALPDGTVLPSTIFSNAEVRVSPDSIPYPGGINGIIQFGYLNMTLEIQGGSQACATSFLGIPDLGCIIGQSLDPLIKSVQFLINGISWIGGWFVFLGQTIANYISVIVWLYDIPDMPDLIQTFVDVVLTIWIIVIVVEGYKKISPFTSG
jgi:hypothetical protein